MVKPGVCGICGVAVVQPEREAPGWHNGHLRERKLVANQTKNTELVLMKVRCMAHKESSDPRVYDRDGNVVDHRDIEYDHDWMYMRDP